MNRLKELRLENGYKSQQDLAAVLFVNQTAVSQWERGVTIPNNQMLIKLSKMYGVSIDYLLGTSNERLPSDGGKKEQPPAEGEELSADELRLLNAYRAASEKRKEAVLDLLED